MERLLRWVAKDLHDGLIGIGGLTTRGYGTVRLRSEKSLPTQNVDLDALATAVKQLVATRDGGGQR